jgi:hypothetical protein
MKKLLVIVFGILLLTPDLLNGQELEARWGELKKVKKTSFVPAFDFAGSNTSNVLIVHYGKKGIVLDVFDKGSLNLTKSIPLDLDGIKQKGSKKAKAQYYKAIVNRDKIYLFIYVDSRGKKEKNIYSKDYPLLGAIFNFDGKIESKWKEIGVVSDFDLESSGYYLNNDKVFFNNKTNLIITEKDSKEGSSYRFFSENLEEIETEMDDNIGSVLFSGNGRIWFVGQFFKEAENFDSCLKVKELKYLDQKLSIKSEKCIKTGLVKIIPSEEETLSELKEIDPAQLVSALEELKANSFNTNFIRISTSLIGETKLRVLTLSKDQNKVSMTEAWELDLDKGEEVLKVTNNLTKDEQESFKKNAISLSYDWEKDKEKKSYQFITPSNAINNLPFFHAEMRNSSPLSNTSSSTGFSGSRQTNTITTTRGAGTNYGYIYTFWLNDSNSIESKWIKKRQHGGMDGEANMFLSYLPFELKNHKYFMFLGNSYNFTFGNNMRLKSVLSKDAVFGYYSIDSKGNVIHKEFKKLSKELNSPPRAHIYHFDGEKFYILALSRFKNKIILIEISSKN